MQVGMATLESNFMFDTMCGPEVVSSVAMPTCIS